MYDTALITYHSAYNFGSALQAYATQQILEQLGCHVEIINYRLKEQKDFYQRLYRTKYGLKAAVNDLTMLPVHKKRKERAEAFEEFFTTYFTLSSEVSEPRDVKELWSCYDTVISGSDQIWNKHSCELEHNSWNYMDPYLLKGYSGRKVSYASSVGNMSDDELQRIAPYIKEFNSVAMRENASAKKMKALLGMPATHVLDPTFLLSAAEWIKKLGLKQREEGEKYILFYSLSGFKPAIERIQAVSRMAQKSDCKVRMVTPFFYLPFLGKRFEWHHEYGPLEFINALLNARCIVTDSYHGTILSVNMRKNFYSLCIRGGSDFRKTDILEQLGLSDRIIYDVHKLPPRQNGPIDYTAAHNKLDKMREHSIEYLKNSLGGAVNAGT